MGSRRFAAALVCALAGVTSCYSPSVDSCIYACNSGACPNGLTCNMQGVCADTATTTCSTVIDAKHDGPTEDTTPPETTITQMPPALDSAVSVDFKFMSSELGGFFECMHDAGQWRQCTSPDTMAGLTTGMHTFEVRAYDAANNVDPTPAEFTWMVDTSIPDTEITSNNPTFLNSTSTSFTFDSQNTTGATFECQLDGAGFTACTSPKMYTGLGEAAHTFQVRAKNAVMVADPSPATKMFTVDVTAPDTTITSGPADPTNMSPVAIMATSNEAGATFECKTDAGAFTACTMPFSYTPPADGAHTVQVRAVDQAGNPDPTPAMRAFTLDTTPPNVSITSPANGSTTGPHVQFAWTSDGTDTCTLDGSAVSCTANPFSQSLGQGPHTFVITSKDALNNTVMKTSTWTVSCLVASAPGAVGIFHFDEGTGQSLTNSVSGGVAGFLGTSASADVADPTWVAGHVGTNALSFPTTGLLATWTPSTPNIQTSVTLETYYYPAPASTTMYDIMSTTSRNAVIYQRGNAGSTQVAFDVQDALGAYHSIGAAITANKWHHLVGTFNGTNTTMAFYIDGALVTTLMTPSAQAPAFNVNRILWGKNANGSAGQVDESLITNTPATPAEVLDRYCP